MFSDVLFGVCDFWFNLKTNPFTSEKKTAKSEWSKMWISHLRAFGESYLVFLLAQSCVCITPYLCNISYLVHIYAKTLPKHYELF